MPPTVILIRHAQALHNMTHKFPPFLDLSPSIQHPSLILCPHYVVILLLANIHRIPLPPTQDESIPDPPLSDLGIEQCILLRESLQARVSPSQRVAIISSPMRRTIQTALLSVDWLLDRARIEVDPDWQENSDNPCDTGSPIPTLLELFPSSQHLDFSLLTDSLWPDKSSPQAQHFANSRASILLRSKRVLDKLHARREDVVLVFSHGAFLREALTGWWFFNADYRVFAFENRHDDLYLDLDSVDDADREEEDVYVDLVGAERDRLRLRQAADTLNGGLGKSMTRRVRLGTGLPQGAAAAAAAAAESATRL